MVVAKIILFFQNLLFINVNLTKRLAICVCGASRSERRWIRANAACASTLPESLMANGVAPDANKISGWPPIISRPRGTTASRPLAARQPGVPARARQRRGGGRIQDRVQTPKQAIAVPQRKTDPALKPHQFTCRQPLLRLAHMAAAAHLAVMLQSKGAPGRFG